MQVKENEPSNGKDRLRKHSLLQLNVTGDIKRVKWAQKYQNNVNAKNSANEYE